MGSGRTGRPRKIMGGQKVSIIWPEDIREEAAKRAEDRRLRNWTWSDEIRQTVAEAYGLVEPSRPTEPLRKAPR